MGLKSCCCGCTLRTGSLIIGYINAVLTGAGFGYCALAFIMIESSSHPSENATDIATMKAISRSFLIGAALILQVLIINCIMLFGVHKGKPAYILPWIVVAGSSMMMQSTSILYIAAVLLTTTGTSFWLGAVVGFLFLFAIQIYSLLIVVSHYQGMKKSSLLDDEEIML